MKGIASHDILPCAGFYLLSLGNQLYYPHTGENTKKNHSSLEYSLFPVLK
jgi:hypothetical protein